MRLAYESVLKRLHLDHKAKVETLETYQYAIEIAGEYADIFSREEYSANKRYSSIVYQMLWTWEPLTLSFYPAKKEPVSVVFPVIDAMIKDERLEMYIPLDKKISPISGHLSAAFSLCKDTKIRILVEVNMARICKKKGTGKYKEIEEYICDEEE